MNRNESRINPYWVLQIIFGMALVSLLLGIVSALPLVGYTIYNNMSDFLFHSMPYELTIINGVAIGLLTGFIARRIAGKKAAIVGLIAVFAVLLIVSIRSFILINFANLIPDWDLAYETLTYRIGFRVMTRDLMVFGLGSYLAWLSASGNTLLGTKQTPESGDSETTIADDIQEYARLGSLALVGAIISVIVAVSIWVIPYSHIRQDTGITSTETMIEVDHFARLEGLQEPTVSYKYGLWFTMTIVGGLAVGGIMWIFARNVPFVAHLTLLVVVVAVFYREVVLLFWMFQSYNGIFDSQLLSEFSRDWNAEQHFYSADVIQAILVFLIAWLIVRSKAIWNRLRPSQIQPEINQATA